MEQLDNNMEQRGSFDLDNFTKKRFESGNNPFKLLGIEPTQNEDLINAAYYGQLKSILGVETITSEHLALPGAGEYKADSLGAELWNLKVARQDCLVYAQSGGDTTLFTNDHLT